MKGKSPVLIPWEKKPTMHKLDLLKMCRNPPGFLEDFETVVSFSINIDCAFYVVSRVIYSYLEKA